MKHRDKEWLREQYVEQGRTQREISELADVSQSVISEWIGKFGLRNEDTTDPKYDDPDHLRELYYGRGLSTDEIGEDAGLSGRGIRDRFEKHGISTRDMSSAKVNAHRGDPVPIEKQKYGYMMWSHSYDGERDRVYVHRLLAVAKYGFDAVAGKDVHHINECKYDNREDNIELHTRSEHTSLHKSKNE